ncbi:hypothetical protein X947_2533 [Burkholderia pseudomallei MSHR7334]|nr:hypothetical protein X947_2533 [Burkholderia pseudomallei MSHR7334]
MKRIEANARACDSGRARLRAAASSAPAEQMHGVCDRRAPKACIGAPCAGNAYGANGRGANGCGANGRIRTRCRALARVGRASARATTTTTQARTTAHRTQSTARLSRATTRSSSRTGRLSSGRRNARALESGGACVASACIPSAIRCSSSHAGAPARAAAARTPLADEHVAPRGLAAGHRTSLQCAATDERRTCIHIGTCTRTHTRAEHRDGGSIAPRDIRTNARQARRQRPALRAHRQAHRSENSLPAFAHESRGTSVMTMSTASTGQLNVSAVTRVTSATNARFCSSVRPGCISRCIVGIAVPCRSSPEPG